MKLVVVYLECDRVNLWFFFFRLRGVVYSVLIDVSNSSCFCCMGVCTVFHSTEYNRARYISSQIISDMIFKLFKLIDRSKYRRTEIMQYSCPENSLNSMGGSTSVVCQVSRSSLLFIKGY